jgi:hypothetical protein
VLLKLHGAREHSIVELGELFSISRATVYLEIARTPAKKSVAGVPRGMGICDGDVLAALSRCPGEGAQMLVPQ